MQTEKQITIAKRRALLSVIILVLALLWAALILYSFHDNDPEHITGLSFFAIFIFPVIETIIFYSILWIYQFDLEDWLDGKDIKENEQ
jgi:hypothetical protein